MIKWSLILLVFFVKSVNAMDTCRAIFGSQHSLVKYDPYAPLIEMAARNKIISDPVLNQLPQGFAMTLTAKREGHLAGRKYVMIERSLKRTVAPSYVHENPFGLLPAIAEIGPDGKTNTIFLEDYSLKPWKEREQEIASMEKETHFSVQDILTEASDFITESAANKPLFDSNLAFIGSPESGHFNPVNFAKINSDTWVVRIEGIVGSDLVRGDLPGLRNSHYRIGLTVLVNKEGLLILENYDTNIMHLKEKYLQEVNNIKDFIVDPSRKTQGLDFNIAEIYDNSGWGFQLQGTLGAYKPAKYEVWMVVVENGEHGKDSFSDHYKILIPSHETVEKINRFFGGLGTKSELLGSSDPKTLHYFKGEYESSSGLVVEK